MAKKSTTVNCDPTVQQRIAANKLRRKMAREGTLVVRLISSPGSGKTLLLEKTAKMLGTSYSLAVLVGDVETDRDAKRLAPTVPTVQMTTGEKCHLEVPLVEHALTKLNQPRVNVLFIEDVGNLICAPSHDLGEHLRVLLLSTTEGDDKAGKFPKAFRTSDVLLVTKTDLLPYVSFSMKQAERDARHVHPALKILAISAQTGEGMATWCTFLMREQRRLMAAGGAELSKKGAPTQSLPSRARKQTSANSTAAKKANRTKLSKG